MYFNWNLKIVPFLHNFYVYVLNTDGFFTHSSLKLLHLYIEQTSQQIMTFERTLSCDEMASLMQNVIERYQIQLGIENDTLQNPIRDIWRMPPPDCVCHTSLKKILVNIRLC